MFRRSRNRTPSTMWLVQNTTDAVQGQAQSNATTSGPQYTGKVRIQWISTLSLPWYKQSHPVPCLENEKAQVLWNIPWHLEKCPRSGANKPDISVLDEVNKEWFIIEGTVCLPGTRPARIMLKRDKYGNLRIGVRSLYSGHKVSSIEVVFDFLAAYSTHLENELKKISQDKRVLRKTIKKSQK